MAPSPNRGSRSVRGPARRARRPTMMWWHHFMVAGTLTLFYNVAWFHTVGGALFGVGFVWWVVGRPYGYNLRGLWNS